MRCITSNGMNPKFKSIVKLFQKLPGVGPRQAARFVIALMGKSEAELQELGGAIYNLKKTIGLCPNCFNISDNSDVSVGAPTEASGRQCQICHDTKRDQAKILVVEKVTDLDSIEKTGLYRGLYHVLGGSINPIDGFTHEALKIRELEARLNKILSNGTQEIELIVATNPNATGETTSLYLRELFQNKKGIALTRLARGLASGSNLEYADEITLKHALEDRK